MTEAGTVPFVELWRGSLPESVHRGRAVIADAAGGIVAAWGDAAAPVYPRSAMKMLQALPLIESGAAAAADLGEEELALACASHSGGWAHVERVGRWLAAIGRGEADLRCGPQPPQDHAEAARLREGGQAPCQLHNNCSGKHAGFLSVARQLGAGPEYLEIDHPVQRSVRGALEEMAGEEAAGWGIDGCSAPNFAVSLAGLARAMARMGAPAGLGMVRTGAARRLVEAMMRHPLLVAGEGRACTELMRAADGLAAIKTGAEGVYTAIVPGRGIGIALKIEDGATRAAETAITALLVRTGCLPAAHPDVSARLCAPEVNRRGLTVGALRAAPALWEDGRPL
jgi:L-asparaginase II